MNRLLIISGPTATGKTDLAIELAKKFNGELISTDSRQVYQGMDIITGKDIDSKNFQFSILNSQNKLRKKLNINFKIGYYKANNIPIWGLDLVKPDQQFHVSAFVIIAKEIIKDIWARHKLPIIVGGTGLYIKSLLNPPDSLGIPRNKKLRDRLESLPVVDLQKILKKTDLNKWDLMNQSDRQNSRRLVRAIEVAESKPKVKSLKQRAYDFLWIGLIADLKFLKKQIRTRVLKRIRLGAEAEIKNLVRAGFDWNLPSMSALGYKEWRTFLNNQLSRHELIDLWALHEYQYAKRQLTWFKKEPNIIWHDIKLPHIEQAIKLRVQKWLKVE